MQDATHLKKSQAAAVVEFELQPTSVRVDLGLIFELLCDFFRNHLSRRAVDCYEVLM
uniref:Uncharacterized protein n=1 Tax=Setaria viridis TaxID=4556 RepID=A0A4U6U887_SETVI|nr:hypothetical protein SEVIR_6G138851v2 [Setaria viridis]